MAGRPPVRGVWIAWPVDFDRHPGVIRFRADCENETADAYLLRAMCFAKAYAPHGCMRPAKGAIADHWGDLAAFVRWPGGAARAEEMREAMRACGLVAGEVDMLLLWETYNGWQIDKYRKDAVRHQIVREAEAKAKHREALKKENARAKQKGKSTKGR